jgi:hypothetical protein
VGDEQELVAIILYCLNAMDLYLPHTQARTDLSGFVLFNAMDLYKDKLYKILIQGVAARATSIARPPVERSITVESYSSFFYILLGDDGVEISWVCPLLAKTLTQF